MAAEGAGPSPCFQQARSLDSKPGRDQTQSRLRVEYRPVGFTSPMVRQRAMGSIPEQSAGMPMNDSEQRRGIVDEWSRTPSGRCGIDWRCSAKRHRQPDQLIANFPD